MPTKKQEPTGKKILKNYYRACCDLAVLFDEIYFEGKADIYPIAHEPDGVWGVNDYFFDIQNMAQAIEYEFTEDELFEWYDRWTSGEDKEISMKNFKKLS